MPIDEEKPNFAIAITNEVGRTIQEQLVSSGVAGALSLVPGVGSAIIEMMTQLAIQRTNERIQEMFEHFTAKIRDIGENKIDQEWFRGEEFQTLLFEALHQLHITHHRDKIKMLGVGLANSGAPGFKEEERKDLFIRFVRELTPQHLRVLLELVPRRLPVGSKLGSMEPRNDESERRLVWGSRPKVKPAKDDLLAMQMLYAYGLVEDYITSSIAQPQLPTQFTSQNQIMNAMKKFSKKIETPTISRTFSLSLLGNDFLKFMGLANNTAIE
jgi:hypothetical protein